MHPLPLVGEINYDEPQTLIDICQSLIGKDPLALGRLIPESIRCPYACSADDPAMKNVVWSEYPRVLGGSKSEAKYTPGKERTGPPGFVL